MNPLSVAAIGKAIFVSITRKRGEPGVAGTPVGDVDIARGYWKFSANDLLKAQQCETLVAVERSVVVGSWRIAHRGWKIGHVGAIPTRIPDADDVNRYWCNIIGAHAGLKSGIRIDGTNGPGPMCGRSYVFNF